MLDGKRLIFVINTGSTSTKIALFAEEEPLFKKELSLDTSEIAGFHDIMEQLDLRTRYVTDFLAEENIDASKFDIVVARGGPTPPIDGGAYEVNDLMVDTLVHASMAQHASSLSCMIGRKIARPYNIPVIIYDSPATDEHEDEAKITGLPEIENVSAGHTLNGRKVARDIAKEMGRSYEDCNFIVAHLGGGFSIKIHKKGRIVDTIFDDMGPMSPTRAGRIPTRFLAQLAYSGKYTYKELRRLLTAEGGIVAHLGTADLREVERRIAGGDEKAKKVFYTMAYQTAKGIAELSAVVSGNVDGIILTGGAANSKMLTGWIKERVEFIAPVFIVPGEREMEALALGGLRVLDGLEPVKKYDVVPPGYKSIEDFYRKIGR